MKSELHWPRVYEEIAFKASNSLFLFLALVAILLIRVKPLAILVEGHLGNIPMKFE